eukprot:COSAG06_NODE_1752_length_8463_cov_6.069943_8_plen_72_part_00
MSLLGTNRWKALKKNATYCLNYDAVYMEGKFGNEMYFVISGEVEVSVGGERLGFLGAEQTTNVCFHDATLY